MLKKLTFVSAATFGIALLTTSPAATIQFETSWNALVSPIPSSSPNGPVSRVVVPGNGQTSGKNPKAALVDADLSRTLAAADLKKTKLSNVRVHSSGRYSLVPAEWNYSIVSHSGPWSDSLVKPGRNEPKVPRGGPPPWAESETPGAPHFPVPGAAVLPSIEVAVSDGGETAALLALGLIGVGCMLRAGTSSHLRKLMPPAASSGPAL